MPKTYVQLNILRNTSESLYYPYIDQERATQIKNLQDPNKKKQKRRGPGRVRGPAAMARSTHHV